MSRTAYRLQTRPARRDSNAALKVLGVIGAFALAWPIGAYALMLMVGVVHAWWPLVPSMPYTVALTIAVLKGAAVLAGVTLGRIARAAFG